MHRQHELWHDAQSATGCGRVRERGGEEEVRGGGEIGETDRGRIWGGMGVERRAFSASAAGEGVDAENLHVHSNALAD